MSNLMTTIKRFIALAAFAVMVSGSLGMYFQDNTQVAYGQTDAMAAITAQVEAALTTTTTTPEVQRENILQAEHLVFGKPVILKTNGVNATMGISADYDMMVNTLVDALKMCTDGKCSDGAVAAQSKELTDRIIYWQETKENLEVQTTNTACDVFSPATCPQLDRGDEPQAFGPGITVGTDNIWNGWYREIRSPYFPVSPYLTSFGPNENVITPPGPIGIGECSVVVKEIQGIKAIQRPVIIPIWQEPWTSRGSIIGFNTVWVVDFVPAEFIKTLNFCNSGGTMTTSYDIKVIIERQLTHFWKYLPAGVP